MLEKYDLAQLTLIFEHVLITFELNWAADTLTQTSLTDGTMMTSHCGLDSLTKWLHNTKKPLEQDKIQSMVKMNSGTLGYIINIYNKFKYVL